MKNLSRRGLILHGAAAAVVSLFLFAATVPFDSFAHTKDESIYLSGAWIKDEVGWRFFNQWNSTYPAGKWAEYQGHSYYFMDNGYMATGWRFINDSWYYFNPYQGKEEGSMVTGWVYDSDHCGWFYTNQIGIMVTGWHKIDGFWYYFNPKSDGLLGFMAVNQFVDGSYVDGNGRMNEVR